MKTMIDFLKDMAREDLDGILGGALFAFGPALAYFTALWLTNVIH